MSEKLEKYKSKRDFEKTNEPNGKDKSNEKEHRYVIQKHDATRLHYDFRLEHNGVMISFAVPKGPSFNPKDKRLAIRVEDHPLEYRNFEGTIPKGEYGGGVVQIFDRGSWEPLGDEDEMIKNGEIKFNLHGERLKGRWVLVRLKNDEEKENWLLIKEKDEFEKDSPGIEDFETSVKSGLTLKEIGKDFYTNEEKNKEKKESNKKKTVDRVKNKKNNGHSKGDSTKNPF